MAFLSAGSGKATKCAKFSFGKLLAIPAFLALGFLLAFNCLAANCVPAHLSADADVLSCSSCHGFPPSSGRHALHVNCDIRCWECHVTAVNENNQPLADHLNGVADIVFADGGTWNGSLCSDTGCHPAWPWFGAMPTQTQTPAPTSTPACTATPTPDPHNGDVDGDGSVTPGDAYQALLLYLGIPVPGADPIAADFCPRPGGDGATEPGDAYGISREYLEIMPPCF